MSVTMHGPDEFTDPTGYWLREKIAASSFVIAVSEYGRSQLMNASDYEHWSKLDVVPLGIDPSDFAERPFREMPAPFQIFYVGRLAPVKGLHLLISAVSRLVNNGRNVRLRVIGGGPDRGSLQEDVTRRNLDSYVVFEGQIHTDKVRVLLRDADAFVMSSFAEGIPVALMEAMAMTIPCVAPQITGIPELIRDGRDGLLVHPANEEALAEAIATLIDDPDLRRRLGEAARRRVVEKFNLGHNTEKLAGVFRRRLTSA